MNDEGLRQDRAYQRVAEAGVAFHDAERDLVSAPAASLVAVGGLPLRRQEEGWSLGGLAPDRMLLARVREAQRQARMESGGLLPS